MPLADKLDKLIDMENMHTFEGRRGVANMCKIARALGYKDPSYGGCLEQGAYLNDLLLFLEDNSGCIEAMYNWISKQRCPEWIELLEERVGPDETDDEDDED